MKTKILLLTALLFTANANATDLVTWFKDKVNNKPKVEKVETKSAPQKLQESKPAPTPALSKQDILNEVKLKVGKLDTELKNAKQENTSLKNSLENAKQEVAAAKLETQTVQKNADSLKAWGVEQQNQAFEWMNKYTAAVKRYHRLKLVAALVSAVAGAMVGMYCMRLVPTVYAAYAFALPIAGAVLAFGAVWMFM